MIIDRGGARTRRGEEGEITRVRGPGSHVHARQSTRACKFTATITVERVRARVPPPRETTGSLRSSRS